MELSGAAAGELLMMHALKLTGRGMRCSRFVRHCIITASTIARMACGRTTKQPGPTIPYDEEGACPFLCCTYREWTVDWDTDLRTDRRDDAPVAFHASLQQTVRALTGVVTTTKVGRASASRQV